MSCKDDGIFGQLIFEGEKIGGLGIVRVVRLIWANSVPNSERTCHLDSGPNVSSDVNEIPIPKAGNR